MTAITTRRPDHNTQAFVDQAKRNVPLLAIVTPQILNLIAVVGLMKHLPGESKIQPAPRQGYLPLPLIPRELHRPFIQ
jgi:hypothetical protein